MKYDIIKMNGVFFAFICYKYGRVLITQKGGIIRIGEDDEMNPFERVENPHPFLIAEFDRYMDFFNEKTGESVEKKMDYTTKTEMQERISELLGESTEEQLLEFIDILVKHEYLLTNKHGWHLKQMTEDEWFSCMNEIRS